MNKALIFIGGVIVGALLMVPIAANLNSGSDAIAATAQPVAAAPLEPAPVVIPAPTDGTPTVVSMSPANGATNVSTATTQLTVVFNVPMRGGFSWTGGGPEFPETTGKPYWAADQKTCVLPVRLKPNWSYRVGLNSPSHRNFKSATGIELPQVVWRFTTGN